MPRVVNNIRRLFRRDEAFLPFKQFNFLNSMPDKALGDLLRFMEQRLLLEVLPTLTVKKVLFISHPRNRYLLAKVCQLNPTLVMEYEAEEFINGDQPDADSNHYRDNICVVKGSLKSPALRSDFFDAVVVPLVIPSSVELDDYIKGLAECLTQSGRLVIVVVHPFLEILLYNQNPSSKTRARIQLQNYFRLFNQHHLYLETLREGVVDKETKSFFDEASHGNTYDEFCGIPLALSLKAVKYVRGRSNAY